MKTLLSKLIVSACVGIIAGVIVGNVYSVDKYYLVVPGRPKSEITEIQYKQDYYYEYIIIETYFNSRIGWSCGMISSALLMMLLLTFKSNILPEKIRERHVLFSDRFTQSIWRFLRNIREIRGKGFLIFITIALILSSTLMLMMGINSLSAWVWTLMCCGTLSFLWTIAYQGRKK